MSEIHKKIYPPIVNATISVMAVNNAGFGQSHTISLQSESLGDVVRSGEKMNEFHDRYRGLSAGVVTVYMVATMPHHIDAAIAHLKRVKELLSGNGI